MLSRLYDPKRNHPISNKNNSSGRSPPSIVLGRLNIKTFPTIDGIHEIGSWNHITQRQNFFLCCLLKIKELVVIQQKFVYAFGGNGDYKSLSFKTAFKTYRPSHCISIIGLFVIFFYWINLPCLPSLKFFQMLPPL